MTTRKGDLGVYVCMCHGVTSQQVAEAAANGADTTKKIAAATGAGETCGRCKATIRQIIAAVQAGEVIHPPPPKRRPERWI